MDNGNGTGNTISRKNSCEEAVILQARRVFLTKDTISSCSAMAEVSPVGSASVQVSRAPVLEAEWSTDCISGR